MPRFGFWEILLVLVIVLVIFGPGKLPQIGKWLGDGIREFKKGMGGKDKDEEKTEEKKQ
jgi:sec-independent protein translocase protein TatA